MAGLHHDSREDTDRSEQKQTRISCNCKLSQVDRFLEGLESLFHVVNAEEQKTHACQYVADAIHGPGFLQDQNDTEHQHRHGIRGDFDFKPEAGHQPGTGCGAQISPKYDTDARCQGY